MTIFTCSGCKVPQWEDSDIPRDCPFCDALQQVRDKRAEEVSYEEDRESTAILGED